MEGLYYSFTNYKVYKKAPYYCSKNATTPDLQTADSKCSTWGWIGIGLAIFTFIISLILLFLRERIKIAIAMIKESSNYILAHLSTLAFPLVPFILKLITIFLCGFFFINAETMGAHSNITVGSGFIKKICESTGTAKMDMPKDLTAAEVFLICFLEDLGGTKVLTILNLFNLFFFGWLIAFIQGFNQLVLAGVFATHYWTFDKRKLSHKALIDSMYRASRYHLGSIAFGSFLIALVQFIKRFFAYLSQKTKKVDTPYMRYLKKAITCCLWLFEKCMKFISKNAYIIVASYGYSFCKSARIAFFLILRNILRVLVLTKILHFILFLGKLVIVLLMALGSYLFLAENIMPSQPTLHFAATPIVVVAACSYLVASIFFQVFEMAVDTIFLCFLEDCERNDGSEARPYFMPRNLMKILGKENRFMEINEMRSHRDVNTDQVTGTSQ